MKLERGCLGEIEFWHRPGFSDLKTFQEVIGRNAYQRRGMKIEPGEKWMDCGGNVGAFTLLACHLGASVTTYEPDPYSCELLSKNLDLNGYRADIRQAALVHNDWDKVTLFIGNNNNVWRNSIVRKWNSSGITVPAVNFDIESLQFDNCKMDIEGEEMPILEQTKKVFHKLVYEWSFDIDPSLSRLWTLIDRQKKLYRVNASWSAIHYDSRKYEQWDKGWFPPCTTVFCFNHP